MAKLDYQIHLDLNKNELQNAVVHTYNSSLDEPIPTYTKGMLVYDIGTGTLYYGGKSGWEILQRQIDYSTTVPSDSEGEVGDVKLVPDIPDKEPTKDSDKSITSGAVYKFVMDKVGGTTGSVTEQLDTLSGRIDTAQSTAEGKQDPIVGGSGITIASDGKTINHSNSVTANTAGVGSTTQVPVIKYDAQGHITSVSTVSIYPPTTPGTSGQYWKSDGSGQGQWQSAGSVASNNANLVTGGTVYSVTNSLDARLTNVENNINDTISQAITTIQNKLVNVYNIKGSLTTNSLPSAPAKGDVYNISIGTTGLDVANIKGSFIDPPAGKYLPNGTNIVCVDATNKKWDVMGGSIANGYSGTITGNGSTTSFELTHNLGSIPHTQVFTSGGDQIVPGIKATTTKVTITFNTEPASNTTYTVICTV